MYTACNPSLGAHTATSQESLPPLFRRIAFCVSFLLLLSPTTTALSANRRDVNVFPSHLHNVSRAGRLEAVVQLLKLNEDLEARDGYGKTPLMAAAKHKEVLDVLLKVSALLMLMLILMQMRPPRIRLDVC